MKKIILTVTIVIFAKIQVFSQDRIHRMNKRTTEIELYDVAGQKHTGYLWYADSFKIVMFDSQKDSMIFIKKENIYQINIHKKWGFGKALGYSSIVATTLVIATVLPIESLIALGTDVIFPVTTGSCVVGGIPLAKHMENKDIIKFKYTINGSFEKYMKLLPVLKKYSRVKKYRYLKKYYGNNNIIKINSIRNDNKTRKIEIPNEYENPFRYNIYHISYNCGYIFTGFTLEFKQNLQSNDFRSVNSYSTTDKNSSFQIGFEYNILQKFRFFANYTTPVLSNFILKSEFYDKITYHSKLFTASSGFSFIFTPTDYTLIKPIEFSISAGLTYTFLNCEYTFERETEKKVVTYQKNYMYNTDIYGLRLATNTNFYLTKQLSVNLNLQADIMMPVIIPGVSQESNSGKIVKTNDTQIKLFTIRQVIGLCYHF